MIMIANADNKPLLNYADALLYVSLLDTNGYTDWRFPTVVEMKNIGNHIDDKFAFHWTSENRKEDGHYCVIANVWGTTKISMDSWKHFVLAVRNS